MSASSPSIMAVPDPQRELKLLESVLSHDVDGSARGIKSLAGILLQKHADLLDGDAGELVRLMHSEAERVSNLLNRLLAWLECTQQPLRFGWQDTTSVVREGFAAVMATYPNRHVEFNLPGLPQVWSDEAALRKIFRELLTNAVKFSASQSHSRVSITAEEKNSETVLAVRDNGVGFDSNFSTQLFDLFRRLHRRNEFPGEGAGLAIVRRLIERHRGRAWVEAKVDEGAIFFLSFPKPLTEGAGSSPAARA